MVRPEAAVQRPQRTRVSGEGLFCARQDRVLRQPDLLRKFGLPCNASYPVLSAGVMGMLCLARAGLPGCGAWPRHLASGFRESVYSLGKGCSSRTGPLGGGERL